MSAADASVLRIGMERLGLAASPSILDSLLAYQALLVKWNAAINLTAVRDPSQMLVQHLLDSLSIVPPIERRLPQPSIHVLDVGSGGGLPGVVLAILRPAWDVTCVDAVGKKVTFVRQVAAELRLPNLRAEHSRIETFLPAKTTAAEDQTHAFDLITSRAFASLHDFTTLTAHLGRKDARSTIWAAMKGKHPAEEIRDLTPSFRVFHVEALSVPYMDAERCLVWMKDRDDASMP